MSKEKEVLNKIKDFALKECQKEFGFAGLAVGENMVRINSGSGDVNLIIKIEIN